MKPVNAVFKWLMKKRVSQVENYRKNPIEVQNKVFSNLINTAKNTEWGKKYSYSDIKSYHSFKSRVPISSYEDIFPFIERVMKGESNLLWPSKAFAFAKSSGTTNARSKFIPITKESLEDSHYKAGKDLIAIYLSQNPETNFFLGKSLAVGGSSQENHLNAQTTYGDVSAIIMKYLPFWAQYHRTPDLDIALMEEWEEKIEKIATATLNQNVTNICGVPTWMLVLLEKVLKLTGKESLHEVWPNLEFFAHGAVAFGPYREVFKKLIPNPDMKYIEIYNASEGFFGIQDTNEPDEMLLLLDYGIFYEFIPTEEINNEHPKSYTLDEVELGKNYAIIISTNAGLWRYKLGDTIKFTSKHPFRIKISGRTKHFINAFGEEVIVENAEHAITKASQVTNARVRDFTVAPIFLDQGKKGGHEWIIEMEQEPESVNAFSKELDSTLRKINSDYDAKRYKDIALIAPKIHFVPKGTFYNWMRSKGKLGGQHKVPRLSNSRDYVESILEMLTLENKNPNTLLY